MKKKLPIVNDADQKTLMPEALPQPPSPAVGSPRQRTVLHMRRILAAAAVAGIAATATRSEAGDAGPDGSSAGDGGGMDSMFIGHDPAPDAGGPHDSGSAGSSGFDSMFVGHDPAGGNDAATDGPVEYDSMFVGHDPAGSGGSAGSQSGNSGGCSVGVPGKKGR